MIMMLDLEEIRQLARGKGIDPEGKSMAEMIRMIQAKEGYEVCFGSLKWDCPFFDCMWRLGCVGISGNAVKAKHIVEVKRNDETQ